MERLENAAKEIHALVYAWYWQDADLSIESLLTALQKHIPEATIDDAHAVWLLSRSKVYPNENGIVTVEGMKEVLSTVSDRVASGEQWQVSYQGGRA